MDGGRESIGEEGECGKGEKGGWGVREREIEWGRGRVSLGGR